MLSFEQFCLLMEFLKEPRHASSMKVSGALPVMPFIHWHRFIEHVLQGASIKLEQSPKL